MDSMMTVKEYAEKHGKSVQAVYKQIRSKENAKRLEGHIIVSRIGNKDVKMLDDEAIRVLEGASMQSPQIIVQTDDKEKIERLEQENENLKIRIMELQEQMIKRDDRIMELADKILLLTDAQKQEEPKKKHWWNRKEK